MKNSCIYGSKGITRRGYQTMLLTDHSNGGRLTVQVRFAKMTGDRY